MIQYTREVRENLENGVYNIQKIGGSLRGYSEYKQMFGDAALSSSLKETIDGIVVEVKMPDKSKKTFYVTPFDEKTVLIGGDVEAWCDAENMLDASKWYLFRIKPELEIPAKA